MATGPAVRGGVRAAKAVVVVIGLSGAVAAWFAPEERWPAQPRPDGRTSLAGGAAAPIDLDSVARVAVAANPFRADRRPAGVRWGHTPVEVGPEVPVEPCPEVRVHGILHGETPMAILSIGEDPAHTLVRVGAEARGVTLRSVSARSVELAWGDSTWTVPVAGGAP